MFHIKLTWDLVQNAFKRSQSFTDRKFCEVNSQYHHIRILRLQDNFENILIQKGKGFKLQMLQIKRVLIEYIWPCSDKSLEIGVEMAENNI